MMKLSEEWLVVASAGHGVLFALALCGLVRITAGLAGIAMPTEVVGDLFLVTSLIAAPVAASFNTAKLMLGKNEFAA